MESTYAEPAAQFSKSWDPIRQDKACEIENPPRSGLMVSRAVTVSARRESGAAIPSEPSPQKVALKPDINALRRSAVARIDQAQSGKNGGGSAGAPFKAGDIDVAAGRLCRVAGRATGHRRLGRPAADTSLLGSPAVAPAASAAACAAWRAAQWSNGRYARWCP